MRAVITGASRGIGLEFARQLLARGDEVEASARNPQESAGLKELAQKHPRTLRLHRCDIGDENSVRSFVSALGSRGVDLLINNAGVGGERQGLDSLDLSQVLKTIDINALGPLRVTKAMLPLLRGSKGRKVVHLSSGMGSISRNTEGGAYGYRMSKAALNMLSRSMALDLRSDGIISVVFNPGWVKTDMGGAGAPTAVEDSVRGMLAVIDRLRPEQSGKFFNYTGEELPF